MRRLVVPVLVLLAAACSKNPPAGNSVSPEPTGVPIAAASAATQSGSPATAAAAGSTAPAAPPKVTAPPADANVILISIDSMRADMPWAGYGRAMAPRLTDLEKKSVSYTRAYSVSSYTSMSLGGLLGDKLPSELSRDGWFFGTYSQDQTFFPELLQKSHVHTMGVQAHFYFELTHGAAGFEQGFDDWQVVPGIGHDNLTDHDITSEKSEALAEKLLGDQANASRRFFFWAHFMDPHDIYNRHDGIDWGKEPRDRYDGEIQYTDGYVGKLLDFIAAQPWAGKTAIIVTADHGEAFGEHGRTRHGFEIWEPLVRVPLMFYFPGADPRHIDEPRSGLDVAQTIMGLLGVAPDPSMEGESLVAEAYGATPDQHDVYVDLPMTSNNAKRRALVRGHNKLLCFDNDQICRLFDLDADPTEDHPISSGDEWKTLHDAYMAHVAQMKELAPTRCGVDCLNGAYERRGQH
jgi:arylsulfatase A-like enzyme